VANSCKGSAQRLDYRIAHFAGTDLGSACGTSVNTTKLEPNKPVTLQNGEIAVADVLRLSVRIEKENERIQVVRFWRIDNLPNMEYICLAGQGIIDTSENALLRLPVPSTRQGRTRALDIGQDRTDGAPATIVVADGKIQIKRTGNDPVTVNQLELASDQTVLFPVTGVIQVGNSFFNIRTP
jgi:hypothetical protein